MPTEPMRIPLEAITSSNIAAFGYDTEKQILAIEFKSGAIFHYAGINLQLATDLYCAPSRGSFYAKHIRGKFQGRKMTGPCPNCGATGWIGETCTDCGTATFQDAPHGASAQGDGA